MATEEAQVDYTLSNPDTLTKLKSAGEISQKVLEAVTKLCQPGAHVVDICEKGDKILEEEVSKVYKSKKVAKGFAHPTTVSPNAYITPYTPLRTEPDGETKLAPGEVVKIQLGAQIDGFGTIVCDSFVVPEEQQYTGRNADLFLATYWANELLLRMMIPPGTVAAGTEEQQKKAAAQKPHSQAKMTQLMEKLVKSYGCNLVEGTTSWLFKRNEIEGDKKLIIAPGEQYKGVGLPELGEFWGVEVGVSLGSGKTKELPQRATLHRRTEHKHSLSRPSSRATLSEIQKKFGTFPFSLRQLEDERAAKVGILESVRTGVVRAYEVVADKDNEAVCRLFTTVALTKSGLTRLAAPSTPDLSRYKTDKKITDEEILKILEQPLSKATTSKSKNKKKKKKSAKKADDEEEEESSDEE